MKNESAFPIAVHGKMLNGEDDWTTEGLTKRELFANSAPAEIPGWFSKYAREKNKVHPFPDWQLAKTEEDRNLLQNWRDDPCYDLPDHLQWYQQEAENHYREREKTQLDREIDTYFRWRIFYAETLLKMLDETTTQPLPDSGESKA